MKENTEKNISSLSVVLPAYNEEGVIRETLEKAHTYLTLHHWASEIIVVDDGSRDQTPAIVRTFQQQYPGVRLVVHKENRGYGEALRSGFDAAQMKWILLMDADGQFDITELDMFLPYTKSYDLIIGFRANRADCWMRTILTYVYTVCINVLFSMKFRDINCGFKLFQKRTWQTIQPIISQDHKVFSVEFLWKAKRSQLQIKQLPVTHYPRLTGTQTGAQRDVIFAMIKALIKLRI